MQKINKLYPHVAAIFGFIIVSILYFYPVLQGKKIYQSDIVQYTGMAKELTEFRTQNKQETYWVNNAFGGMPTYQMGAKYPNDVIGAIDDMIRFLPRPADYLFLYFVSFYIMLLVLKIDPLKAFFGALAFGFSTYLIIILGVGHNAKAHAIAYMPLVVAGVLLVFKKQYWKGGLLTLLATALELNANHFQMTYYLLFLLIFVGVFYAYKFIKAKEYKELGKVALTFFVALVVALGVNATSLLATKEYAEFSTRSKSELKLDEIGKPKKDNSALSRSYITEYSYGIAESLNLIAPKLFGGGNNEKLGNNSSVYKYLESYGASPEEATFYAEGYGKTYWGNQPIVAAPAYIGAVVFFLFVLAMYHDKRKIKWVFFSGAVFSLLLSWGKNFAILTDFFIDYVPMYDKFRAVSSIQVLLELCMPAMAVMGLYSFFTTHTEKQWDSLKKAALTCLGLLVILFFAKGMFDFSGPIDKQLQIMFSQMEDKSFAPDFLNALREDRRTMYTADLLRSGFFITLAIVSLWLFIKNKMAQTTTVIFIGLLMVLDLFFIDKNYVSSQDFKSAREVDMPFEATTADNQILQDTTHYRVFEVEESLSNPRASYFHKSISGYSAVKPKRMQELFDYQIKNNNRQVLNMLNVKYLIQTDDKGQPFAVQNPQANGNAWFVSELKHVNSADEEMQLLSKLDTKNTAITQNEVSEKVGLPSKFYKDSLATIKLVKYASNKLKYASNNSKDGFAVFSEVYYKDGWKATIDGKNVPILKVNYTLRGLQVPAGKHTIEFVFDPEVVKTGSTIALISSIIMFVLLFVALYLNFNKKKTVHA